MRRFLHLLPVSLACAASMAASRPLSWAPPVLTDPEVVTLTTDRTSLKLDLQRDYVIRLPEKEPLFGGVSVHGGRNVVLIGGEIRIPSTEEFPGFKGSRRGMYLKSQTGTVHVEGVLISGAGLQEGFNLDQRHSAIVQIQNVRVEQVVGGFRTNHADVVQTWAGPAELRIDRMTGLTGYQGFFLLPTQHDANATPDSFDFRRLNLVGDERSAYLLWRDSGQRYPVLLEDVWVQPGRKDPARRDAFLWPRPSTGDTTWTNVSVGLPPSGDFVPAGAAGLGYVSPGYRRR